jgi:hypothetical protein
MLCVYPKSATPGVNLTLKIVDESPSCYHFFKIDAQTDMTGHKLMSPVNRNLVRSSGIYAKPREVKPAEWVEGFKKIPLEDRDGDGDGEGERQPGEGKQQQGQGEFSKNFFKNEELGNFLSAGTLSLVVKVSMKEVEIVHNVV